MKENFLESLRKVRWDVAFKTFGSSHATLIGLLVQWWIASTPSKNRYALDGGLGVSSKKRSKRKKRGVCDAVFVEGSGAGGIAKGILEVEGSGYVATIKKMGDFFESSKFKSSLEFGIFLAYPTSAWGRGVKRSYSNYFPEKDFIREGKRITKGLPDKKLAVLVLKKSYDKFEKGNLREGEFHRGTPVEVYGVLLCNGEISPRRTLWPLK